MFSILFPTRKGNNLKLLEPVANKVAVVAVAAFAIPLLSLLWLGLLISNRSCE